MSFLGTGEGGRGRLQNGSWGHVKFYPHGKGGGGHAQQVLGLFLCGKL